MSYDHNTEPTDHERTLPLPEAVAKITARLLGERGDIEVERAVRNAVTAIVPAYVPPDRPIDVVVSIADDDGLEAEQTVHLTREQASRPELLGGAVGGAAAAALRAFHVVDDGDAAVRAVAAAELQLRNAP